VIIFVQYNVLYDLPTHLQSLNNKPTGAGKEKLQQFGKSTCFSQTS
jgi:hypothetical protein